MENNRPKVDSQRGVKDDPSSFLRYAIENQFPYPIAHPFYELRSSNDWKAEIP